MLLSEGNTVADPGGSTRDARTPPPAPSPSHTHTHLGSVSFTFRAVSSKKKQYNSLASAPLWLAYHHLENLGSAAVT